MRKNFLFVWLCMLSAVALAQNPNNSPHPSKGKINLLNFNNLSSEFTTVDILRAKKFAFSQLIQDGQRSVVKFYSLNYQTLYFLNSWWLEEVGKDSLGQALIEKSIQSETTIGEIDVMGNIEEIPLEFLKKWKKTLTLEQRKNIQFQSFMSKALNRFNSPSIIIYLDEILKNIKGLDVEIQSHVDAIAACKEIMEARANSMNDSKEGSSEEQDMAAYSYNDFRFELKNFYQNINQIDSAVASLIDAKYSATWKGFVKMVNDDIRLHPNNPWGVTNRYQDEDPMDWSFQIESNRLFYMELGEMMSDANNYIILVNNEDFYNLKLSAPKKMYDNGSKFRTNLYTTLIDLYSSKSVKRYLYRTSSKQNDSTNTIDSNAIPDDYVDVNIDLDVKLLQSDTSNLELVYVNKDSIVSLYQDSAVGNLSEYDTSAYLATPVVEEGETYHPKEKRIVLESSYKRCYNNINEMLDIIKPTEPRMEHISFVGGSVGISNIRSDGNENVYKFNYHQTYGVESLNNFWGHLIGFQIDGGLYRNKFMNLAFLTNYTYGEFTITKEPSGGDVFVVNPQKLYQVKNSFFTIASGLDLKVNLSAIYVHATGGYQWDLSDGRWKYEGNYVNSLGKLKMNGGYFELGLGFNIGVK